MVARTSIYSSVLLLLCERRWTLHSTKHRGIQICCLFSLTRDSGLDSSPEHTVCLKGTILYVMSPPRATYFAEPGQDWIGMLSSNLTLRNDSLRCFQNVLVACISALLIVDASPFSRQCIETIVTLRPHPRSVHGYGRTRKENSTKESTSINRAF